MTSDVQKHYRALVKEHGDSHLTGQYSSLETQRLRFSHLLRCGDIQGSKVLDFGCGTAALASYLHESDIQCEYYGYDFVEEFRDIVDQKYAWSNFVNEAEMMNMKFDFIFISGVFNNKVDSNEELYQSTLKKLFGITRKCIGFNMMSAYVDYFDDGLYYEYPENVFRFCKKNITPYVTIINDYQLKKGTIPFEFACFLYKK